MTTRELVGQYVELLCRIYGKHLKTVILYDFYARGDYTKDSDIDIKLITKNQEYFNKWVEVYTFYSNEASEGIKLFDAA